MAYIKRETALEIIDKYDKTVEGDDAHAVVLAVRDIISTICPGADVSKVRHAHWSKEFFDNYYCSHCGMGAPFARYRRKNGTNERELTDYCPSCGAIMDDIELCSKCSWNKNGKKNHESGVCLYCHIGERFETAGKDGE